MWGLTAKFSIALPVNQQNAAERMKEKKAFRLNALKSNRSKRRCFEKCSLQVNEPAANTKASIKLLATSQLNKYNLLNVITRAIDHRLLLSKVTCADWSAVYRDVKNVSINASHRWSTETRRVLSNTPLGFPQVVSVQKWNIGDLDSLVGRS